jgi:copper chaperone CopZ
MRFRIENMTCGGCARSVIRTIQKVDPAAEVRIDVEARSVEVNTKASPEALTSALDAAGFPAVA